MESTTKKEITQGISLEIGTVQQLDAIIDLHGGIETTLKICCNGRKLSALWQKYRDDVFEALKARQLENKDFCMYNAVFYSSIEFTESQLQETFFDFRKSELEKYGGVGYCTFDLKIMAIYFHRNNIQPTDFFMELFDAHKEELCSVKNESEFMPCDTVEFIFGIYRASINNTFFSLGKIERMLFDVCPARKNFFDQIHNLAITFGYLVSEGSEKSKNIYNFMSKENFLLVKEKATEMLLSEQKEIQGIVDVLVGKRFTAKSNGPTEKDFDFTIGSIELSNADAENKSTLFLDNVVEITFKDRNTFSGGKNYAVVVNIIENIFENTVIETLNELAFLAGRATYTILK